LLGLGPPSARQLKVRNLAKSGSKEEFLKPYGLMVMPHSAIAVFTADSRNNILEIGGLRD